MSYGRFASSSYGRNGDAMRTVSALRRSAFPLSSAANGGLFGEPVPLRTDL